MPIHRAFVAEFVGTFALMFVGGGAIIVTGGENLVAIALAHGLILAVMVSATMHISGGQINPAVSIGLALIKKQPWSQAVIFIIAQVGGSVVAALLLRVLLAGTFEIGTIGATLGPLTDGHDPIKTNVIAALGLEAIGTFFLMFVIMGTAVDKRGVGGSAAAFRAAGGLGRRVRQRVDALHRRWRVRHGRRDWHQHRQAPRTRSHGPRGAHHL